MPALRIPITNIYGGDYTAAIQVGSQKAAANVILDTGSSTLAVTQKAYRPELDASRKATSLAQDIAYITGGWAGPVLNTVIGLNGSGGSISLNNGAVAVALDQLPNNFGAADGILGLAYQSLNTCYNLKAFLAEKGVNPPVTYPWPFPPASTASAIEQVQKLFQTFPQSPLPPFFTQLVDAKKTINKFAFYTKRSIPKPDQNDPDNHGFFILGGGEEQADLFQGNFVQVKVVHDAWYNTTLKSVKVDGAAAVPVPALAGAYKKQMISNSVIDSGTNSLALSTAVFTAILESLDPGLRAIAIQALQSKNGVANAQVQLLRWPNITFTLAGANGKAVPLICSPQTYWQLDAGAPGRAAFQINDMGQVQCILGLPLFNNYYVVFDRSVDKSGVVSFAPIK